MFIETVLLCMLETVVPYDGITLYNANNGPESNRTVLINNDGEVINQWIGASQIASTPYLLQGGELLRPCRANGVSERAGGGRIQKFSYEGDVLWDFTLIDDVTVPHHDICPMPNGNVLLIAFDKKTQVDGIAAGRQNLNSEIWPEQIIEVKPTGPDTGEIVWRWHLWDHIIQDVNPSIPNYGVIAQHPEKIDINKGALLQNNGDWIHANALDYNPVLDQIVFSSNSLDEIFIINHSITTEEAAGEAGDFMYRWGNPNNYERNGAHVLWNVHGVNWIDEGLQGAGNMLLFNNGNDDNSSDIIEFVPPIQADGTYEIADSQPFAPIPGDYVYFYESNDFHGGFLCGVYRLPNGNTIATNGPDKEIRELNQNGEVVWQHFLPDTVMRAVKYSYDILSPEPETCLGDLNLDGSVNVTDLLMVIGDWGQSESISDVNSDGVVNVSDILMLIGNWGACP